MRHRRRDRSPRGGRAGRRPGHTGSSAGQGGGCCCAPRGRPDWPRPRSGAVHRWPLPRRGWCATPAARVSRDRRRRDRRERRTAARVPARTLRARGSPGGRRWLRRAGREPAAASEAAGEASHPAARGDRGRGRARPPIAAPRGPMNVPVVTRDRRAGAHSGTPPLAAASPDPLHPPGSTPSRCAPHPRSRGRASMRAPAALRDRRSLPPRCGRRQ